MQNSVRIALLCAVAAALSYCDRVNLSVAIVYLARERGLSETEKSGVLSAFYYGYIVTQFVGAELASRFGGRNVLGVASVLWSISTAIVPALLNRSVGSLVAGRIALGLCEGVTFPVIYYMYKIWVPETDRSRAIAAMSIGSLLGAVFSFLVCPLLIERLGWPSVFYFFGLVLGPAFTYVWFKFVPLEPPAVISVQSLAAISAIPPSPERGTFSSSVPPSPTTESISSALEKSYVQMMRDPLHLSIFFCHFSHNLAHFALMSWLPTFFHAEGYEGDNLTVTAVPYAVVILTVVAASSLADRIIAARPNQVLEVRRVFTFYSFLFASLCMAALALVSIWGKRTTSDGEGEEDMSNNVEEGFLYYHLISLALLCAALAGNASASVAGYDPTKLELGRSPRGVARIQSLSNTLACFSAIVGVPAVGYLKGPRDESFYLVFLALGLFFAAAGTSFYRHAAVGRGK